MKDTNDTGIGVIGIEMIVIGILVGKAVYSFFDLSWQLSTLIAIFSAIVFVTLLMVKYLGFVLQAGMSILLTYIILELIDKFFHMSEDLSERPVELWIIRIVIGIIVLLILEGVLYMLKRDDYSRDSSKTTTYVHIKTADNVISGDYTEEDIIKARGLSIISDIINKLDSKYKEVESIGEKIRELEFNEMAIDKLNEFLSEFNTGYRKILEIAAPYMTKGSSYLVSSISNDVSELNKRYKNVENSVEDMKSLIREAEVHKEQRDKEQRKHQESTNRKQDENLDTTLFEGCNDIESLSKRYKKLMQLYHPDNMGGASEMAKKINNTYDILCKKYS